MRKQRSPRPSVLTALFGLAFLGGCFSATPVRPPRGTDASGDTSDSLRAQDVYAEGVLATDTMNDSGWTPQIDGMVPDAMPFEVPGATADSPVSSDLGSATTPDLAPSKPEAALDSPHLTADLSSEKTPDTSSALNPDLGQDTDPITGPDTAPSSGFDSAPDLRPDTAPDLSPDSPVLKPRGAACQVGSECADGVCVGHICCNRECSGECEECTAATNGLCSFKNGTQCRAATGCMNAASCSGTSASCPSSTPKPAGTPCGTITCSGSTQSGPTCNASGSCGASTNKECYPFACANGTGCKTSCTVNADCVSDHSTFCGANGTCTVNSQCWHATDGTSAASLLWQVNPKEPNDPVAGPYAPAYHSYSDSGNTPDDVCKALTLCGFSDWKVPTIGELRALIRGCAATATGGTCGVTDTCLGTSCESGCQACEQGLGTGSEGCYLPAGFGGPCFLYWSSSVFFDTDRQSYRYRQINFTSAAIQTCDPSDSAYVRCVRHSP